MCLELSKEQQMPHAVRRAQRMSMLVVAEVLRGSLGLSLWPLTLGQITYIPIACRTLTRY